MYDQLDYDVFILTQKADGYTVDNQNKISALLNQKNRKVIWRFIEDYPKHIHRHENELCERYQKCVTDAKKNIQDHLITNGFVTRLWYRRWLNNQMRIEYERSANVKYDWVVRTRFDIGYRITTVRQTLKALSTPPTPQTVYSFPDTISCGSPPMINYESELINHWPYIYNKYIQTKKWVEPLSATNHDIINKWLFMSEMNLIQYWKESPYQMITLPFDLRIVRDHMINSVATPDLNSDHIVQASYGCLDHWVDVTQRLIASYVANYDTTNNRSQFLISNELSRGDPMQYHKKDLVIYTLETNEYVYHENTVITLKYHHYFPINCLIRDIVKISYGVIGSMIDATQRVIGILMNNKGVVYVSNQLVECDPSPGVTKLMIVLTRTLISYEFKEYSIVQLIGN
jgi:hypothetical protein